jgi:hypothetical protein
MTAVVEGEKKIARSRKAAVLYIPKEGKRYFRAGDTVKVEVKLIDGQARLIATKQLANFGLDGIRRLADEFGFKVEYAKSLGDVEVFSAVKGDTLSLSYTQNLREEVVPTAYVTISKKWLGADNETYERVTRLGKDYKKYNGIVRPEGDLDVINLLKEPERYELDVKGALELLRKGGKKAGWSLALRFDSLNNKIDEIRNILQELKSA